MLQNKEKLFEKIDDFNTLTGSNIDAISFYEKIEARAKELAPFSHDTGWMAACHEAVVEIFDQSYLNKLENGQEPPTLGVKNFLQLFDENVMTPYVEERKNQGEPMDITSSYGTYNSPSVIKAISDLIKSKTIPSLKDEVMQKFKSGELTVDSALSFAKEQKDSRYTKDAYFMLGSYADAIEAIHEKRSFLDMLKDIPTYFKEWRTARMIRGLIKKNSNPEGIENAISEVRRSPAVDTAKKEVDRLLCKIGSESEVISFDGIDWDDPQKDIEIKEEIEKKITLREQWDVNMFTELQGKITGSDRLDIMIPSLKTKEEIDAYEVPLPDNGDFIIDPVQIRVDTGEPVSKELSPRVDESKSIEKQANIKL